MTMPDIIGSPNVNQLTGEITVIKQDPMTGSIVSETIGNVGPSKNYIQSGTYQDASGAQQFWGLTPSGTIERKAIDAGRVGGGGASPDAQLYSGLSSPTATAVRAQVASFKTEPKVQEFATIQEGKNFASAIDTKTKNPADDQALIYSLAKALDPGSVVREGEYNTAQKYAQSWVNAYGKGVTQALAGTGFLSEQARDNIKKVIEQKYEFSKKSYENLYSQYETGINNLTGRNDGSKFLRDYKIPETVAPQATETEFVTSSGKKFTLPGGATVSTSTQATVAPAQTPARQPVTNPLSGLGQGYSGFNLTSLFK
jgi:hypothetical protein